MNADRDRSEVPCRDSRCSDQAHPAESGAVRAAEGTGAGDVTASAPEGAPEAQERVQRYVDAGHFEAALTRPDTIGGQFAMDCLRAVMAVADAEQAELRAEVERWRTMWDRHGKNDLLARAEAAEAKVAELRRILLQGAPTAAADLRAALDGA